MQATLDLVAEQGVQAATVRAISERAEVTQGLIRHYFSTKEELILAAYEYHMNALTDQASAAAEAEHDSARGKLAGFMTMLLRDPAMRQIHERSYVYFRNRLRALIAEALT